MFLNASGELTSTSLGEFLKGKLVENKLG